ncbi:MAG: potassium channel protein [Rhodospirillaceae bacterium]|nr:potassium channel protein [Rhodospirillaceae bacterium]|tara:strand:- start:287 stop:1213 length:927 start_codon:yes stop_codon:yes gene_type:complete
MVDLRYRIYQLLEKAEDGDRASRLVDIGLFILVSVNVLAVSLETIDSLHRAYADIFLWIEVVSVFLFTLEYGLRFWSVAASADERGMSSLKARLSYVLSPTGIIDLVAILPSLLPLLFGSIDLRWLRILRLARLFKFSHYTTALEDLISSVRRERQSFVATIYLLFLALMISSTLIYVFEHELQPENFGSIPESMWWSFVTLTTVGYGDVVPITAAGRAIAGLTALMGVCVVALLTGIVATGFSKQMAMKQSELEDEVEQAMADGYISTDEQARIDRLTRHLHLSTEEEQLLLARLKAKHASRSDKIS